MKTEPELREPSAFEPFWAVVGEPRPHRATVACWCRPFTGRDRWGRVVLHCTPKTEETP